MRCFVVNDPERILSGKKRLKTRTEQPINANKAKIPGHDSSPTRLARSVCMLRKNPLANTIVRDIERAFVGF